LFDDLCRRHRRGRTWREEELNHKEHDQHQRDDAQQNPEQWTGTSTRWFFFLIIISAGSGSPW
jgi:hypothetical protein